jgi:hypothetical protein
LARKFDIPKTYELDFEIVDRMAIHSLKDHYNIIVESLDEFVLHQKGHPDEYDSNLKLKEAFKIVLDYYGE